MAMKAAIKNLKTLRKEIDGIDKTAAKVERLIISDIKKRAPGKVAAATSKVYAINKNEVARAQSKNASKFAGKQHVKTSFRGQSLDDFTMVFTGKKTATWNIKAGGKPAVPTARTWTMVNYKWYNVPAPYKVTAKVYRKQRPQVIKPKGDTRVFVAMVKGKLRPMVIGKDKDTPLVKAFTSVPQAIMNEEVAQIWRADIKELIIKRYTHHTKRYWKGEIK
jgi:hypothetical protein